jgi:PAS domain S-box-containing protein
MTRGSIASSLRSDADAARLLETTRAERDRLRFIADHTPLLLVHCDRDWRFTFVNAAYAARLKTTPEALIGRSVRDVLSPSALAQATPYIERVLAGETVDITLTEHADGVPHILHGSYTPERNASGEVIGWVAGFSNMTVVKATEGRLRDFALLVENASDFIGVCDLSLRPVYLNAAAMALVGVSAADLGAISVLDLFHPDDRQHLAAEFFPAVERNGRGSIAIRFRHFKTGASIPMHYSVVRLEDGDGRPTGYATISQDLSERHRTENMLRVLAEEREASLARFRELADAMPQIVWSCDASGRVDYLNRRWYELTGKPPADLDPSGVIYGEDVERAQAAFRESVASGQPFQEEYRLTLPNEPEPRWYLGRALPVRDESGQIVRWYATSTDIHDQKQAEALLADSRERLRAALDASVTGTFRWDIDTNALDWDDNLDRLFGLAPGATARSLSDFIRLVHPDDRQRVIDACARCAATGAPFDEEFRVVWPDGTVRWLSDKGRVYAGPHGTRYMTGACVDVTDRRMKEEALHAADRQKDEFLGMLAHEIRNPLAPMMYSASILDRRIQDPELRRPLEVIARQARRMNRIVDDLLDVSRVTQGKISLQRDSIGIADVIAQCAEASRPGMDARRQTFVVEPVDPSLTVNGDAVRLAQVIENLLINAAKYTPDGGTITIGAVAATGGMVEISVRDTGVGISDDMIGRVFDLFAQADRSLDRAEGGLGIGLTLVDRLVQMHGGRVAAHSDGPGLGSTFTISLPLVVAAAPAANASPSDVSSPRRRVLIVDDNLDSAEMLGVFIEMSGHDVRLVHDGRAAADEAAKFLPDLVLLDIGLPGLDGYHVIQQLRAMPEIAAATIVATTGYGRDEDRARCFAAGFDEHLTKPVDPSQIHRILAMPARS